MNRSKLLKSKWTAVKPLNKEKHFIVTQCFHEKGGKIDRVKLEALYTKSIYDLHWKELKNKEKWIQGWQ